MRVLLSEGSALPARAARKPVPRLWMDVLFVLFLIAGAWLRLDGLGWDENTQMHPDERFMMMVASGIRSVPLSDYFNTTASALNPSNAGYGFYVYGTLPLFIVRYLAEAADMAGYGSVAVVGRIASSVVDLLTVLVVYAIARRLIRKQWAAVLAGIFYSLAVLPIQLSHFFKEDPFLGFFSALTFLCAAYILPVDPEDKQSGLGHWGWYLGFGVAFGMAMATKVMIAPMALVLPGAALLRWSGLKEEARTRSLLPLAGRLAAAGLLAFLIFRVFQPYAFTGPGFFNMLPSEQWVNTMRSIAAQNAGDVDFPPQLQWARRPIWFSLQNQVLWGLGVALGVSAWSAYLWMGWLLLSRPGEFRRRYVLIWLWTGLYFVWQSTAAARTLRYMMPIYPLLMVIAAWGLCEWQGIWRTRGVIRRLIPELTAGLAVILTALWALAFTSIYRAPFTRAEASRWFYQNVSAPIVLPIQTSDSVVNQPLALRYGTEVHAFEPLRFVFDAREDGSLDRIAVEYVLSLGGEDARENLARLSIDVARADSPEAILASGKMEDSFPGGAEGRGIPAVIVLNQPLHLEAGSRYMLNVGTDGWQGGLKLRGMISAHLTDAGGGYWVPLVEAVSTVQQGQSSEVRFRASDNGLVSEVFLTHVLDWEQAEGEKALRVSLLEGGVELAQGEAAAGFLPKASQRRGNGYQVALNPPVELREGVEYVLSVSLIRGEGRIAVYGEKPIRETAWDDPLPLGMGKFDPYGLDYGPYRSDLNLDAYADDNPQKLESMLAALDEGDIFYLSSNRQWGTTTRVPERYPLMTWFYRELAGCPLELSVFDCYAGLETGMYEGRLGFSLVKTFTSYPRLGSWVINDQYAEEAFSVYDHPKVLIFRKSADYDSRAVRESLSSVDLSKVVHLSPSQAGKTPGLLLMDAAQKGIQRAGGTWKELFQREALLNRYPAAGVAGWYLVVSLLGWAVYPILRMGLRALPDKGYPLARVGGMLLLAWPVWALGSNGVEVNRGLISLIAGGLVVLGLLFAWLQRKELCGEWRSGWKYFLLVEGLALAFFVIFLLVRLGNPDLWHPWKGGEKPMDFSYFNAVLKSSIFPPYDPWFAGGYLNYYYYGFVLVGVPVKWLGLVPAFAYNLILPLLFSTLAMGGFSAGWNIRIAMNSVGGEAQRAWGAGLWSACLLAVLGNLGIVRMIWQGIMRLAAPGGDWTGGNIFQRLGWTAAGLVELVRGASLTYARGDWYWIPSRALPHSAGNPITEFPAFTFLYADLHAHLIALSVTVFAMAVAIALMLGQWRWGDGDGKNGWLHYLTLFSLGGLAIGALRPVNTWDFPAYLLLALLAIVYACFTRQDGWRNRWGIEPVVWRLASLGFSLALLTSLSLWFYAPFTRWYGQGYNELRLWDGARSPTASYLVHWGIFLFLIVTVLFTETVDWMRRTPLSALARHQRWKSWIPLLLAGLAGVCLAAILLLKVWIAWLVLPLMAWCLALLLRPDSTPGMRMLLFLVGTALALTLFVELAVLVGDIERMNTVFKFYLQAWTLLAVAGGAGLSWVCGQAEHTRLRRWFTAWQTVLVILIGGGLLFPLLAGADKINDRMSMSAPRTLDGMKYMETSTYFENEKTLQLDEDYRAIRWMQENIPGSPVIVEANVPEYRWGNRFTINTGLPSVVGWNWHQRQQRAITPDTWVTDRVNAIQEFYSGENETLTLAFLHEYEVQYIIVGQLEYAVYPAQGLAKFAEWDGVHWDAIYRDGQTVIYKVR